MCGAHAPVLIPLELAPLSDAERRHEARVRAHIGAALDGAGGWLPFAEYMQLALYAPGLGYYAAGAHKLGAGGDFVTAPEISPVFGRCLASHCGAVLAALGDGEILELGAGSGALAEQLLLELARVDRVPRRYRILEPSPELRERQQRRLALLPPALAALLHWDERVPPAPLEGVVLANEVLDALPVERFRIARDGVEELGVIRIGEAFGWGTRRAGAALIAALAGIANESVVALPVGQVGEVCLRLGPWLAAVSLPLTAGVLLLIDYGLARRDYYAAERGEGTLGCFHRQRRHDDPFVNVGLQDLTAWVDFTRVAEAAVAAGLEIAGYTTQANFLLDTDFEAHLARLTVASAPADAALSARAAARLVLPAELGERYKCMALARDWPLPLAGFRLRDYRRTL